MGKKIFYLILIIILINPIFGFTNGTPIQGKPSATQSQVIQWMKDKNISDEIIDLVPYIYQESKKANIDPVLVICQSSLETAYYTSYTFREYHNTAGIKSRSNTNKYAYYDSYKEGFKAQINHLALYRGNPQEGYYYSSRLDGWVTSIEGLTGTWAEDRKYSNKILQLMNQVYNYDDRTEKEIPKKETEKKIVKKTKTKVKKPTDTIYDILNRKNKNSKGYDMIMKYLE